MGAGTLIVSSIYLIPTFGVIGAAYGVVLAFIAMSAAIYLKTYSLYPVRYNWRGIIFPVFFLAGIQAGIDGTLFKLAVSLIFPLLWYTIAITDQERDDLLRILR